jgi:hypothetical protein
MEVFPTAVAKASPRRARTNKRKGIFVLLKWSLKAASVLAM